MRHPTHPMTRHTAAKHLPSTLAARYFLPMLRAVATIAALAVVQASGPARAELVTWTDKEGVVHVEGGPAKKQRRKRAVEAPPASAATAGKGAVPEWQKPNAPPRSARKSKTLAKTSSKKSRWWERRTDAPPDEIDRAAEQYKIPAELIRAVIAAESNGDAGAISHKGAIGLMQLMPQTAGDMYVQDPVDPAQNVMGGTRYLRYLANLFGGDMVKTIAAYNAGPEAVRKYGGVPPYAETREYVRRVMNYYFELKRLGSGKKLAQADGKSAGGVAGGMQ
jgi:soluble lytic murein transglycosylase-like protein